MKEFTKEESAEGVALTSQGKERAGCGDTAPALRGWGCEVFWAERVLVERDVSMPSLGAGWVVTVVWRVLFRGFRASAPSGRFR